MTGETEMKVCMGRTGGLLVLLVAGSHFCMWMCDVSLCGRHFDPKLAAIVRTYKTWFLLVGHSYYM